MSFSAQYDQQTQARSQVTGSGGWAEESLHAGEGDRSQKHLVMSGDIFGISIGRRVLTTFSGKYIEYLPPQRRIWFKSSVGPRLGNHALFSWTWTQILGVPLAV